MFCFHKHSSAFTNSTDAEHASMRRYLKQYCQSYQHYVLMPPHLQRHLLLLETVQFLGISTLKDEGDLGSCLREKRIFMGTISASKIKFNKYTKDGNLPTQQEGIFKREKPVKMVKKKIFQAEFW